MGNIFKISASVLLALLAGCAAVPPEDYCGIQCSIELYEQNEWRYIASPQLHRQRYSTAARSKRAASERAARGYVTAAGPQLALYGLAGAAGYVQVAECKSDVIVFAQNIEQRNVFVQQCYALLPEQYRQAVYESDQRVPHWNPTIILLPSQLIHGCIACRPLGLQQEKLRKNPTRRPTILPAYSHSQPIRP